MTPSRPAAKRVQHAPDPHPARARARLPQAEAEGVASFAEALLASASCADCAFRDRPTRQCRAYPPVAAPSGPVWPVVLDTHWCGCWRPA